MRKIKRAIAAAALLATLATPAAAQTATTLGRWMQSQPASVLRSVGCDQPLPYATRCWRHVTEGGRIVGTWTYVQDNGRIVMWYSRR